MTVIEFARELLKYDPEAEVEFKFFPDGELRLDIDDVEIDGDTVIIPQHNMELAYRNIFSYSNYLGVVINLKPDN